MHNGRWTSIGPDLHTVALFSYVGYTDTNKSPFISQTTEKETEAHAKRWHVLKNSFWSCAP